MIATIRAGARALLNMLIPPQCGVCGKATVISGSICAACWQQVQFISRPICDVLGAPQPVDAMLGDFTPYISLAAQTHPPQWRKARAATHYAGIARQCVYKLKYADHHDMARIMAQAMCHAGADLLESADFLVPIPLHWGRVMRRQFNQAHILAAEIAKQADVCVLPRVLRRHRKTRPQVGLTRAQRAANVDGAFMLAPQFAPLVRDKAIVLIDDVRTTGATANAAAQCLLRAGAASVDVLTFALVTHDMQND